MQFVPVLAVAAVTFVLLFAFVNVATLQPQRLGSGITGQAIVGKLQLGVSGGNDHYFIAENHFVGRVPKELARTSVEVTDGFFQDAKGSETTFYAATLPAYNEGYVEFTVLKDSFGGPMVIKVNDEVVFKDVPKMSRNWVSFDKDLIKQANKLEISADNGWQFWNGADYRMDVVVGMQKASIIDLTFSPYTDYPSAEFVATLSQTRGNLIVKFNGQTVYSGKPDYNLIRIPLGKPLKENTIYIDAPLGDSHTIEYADIVFAKQSK